MASSSSSSTVGNRLGSGLVRPRLRSCSHWAAQFSTRLNPFGSAIMRRTCASSTAGCRSVPALATRISSASGMLAQRKYERREASSMSLTGNSAIVDRRSAIVDWRLAIDAFGTLDDGRWTMDDGRSTIDARGLGFDSTRNRKFGDARIA